MFLAFEKNLAVITAGGGEWCSTKAMALADKSTHGALRTGAAPGNCSPTTSHFIQIR